ncbi:aldo/keto reductase [Paraglaciecola chathamensis]|jgi:D-xylose reductase|uniref:Aldehyde reductase n=3 Tax=Paraglaciecola chathamensis TaxID=368405 RepID=A0A8H9M2T6_9ALTE|nr:MULTISPECIES: aldo/keto reductase [Paraglaciecola]AEE22405.1 aldo/keto reductase [Glaciecola sp. 4H-3-7+YE-5]MBN24041.1 aldo/keto reductase [Alteromonadaceae bacterium]GAC07363.1 probable NAD(P)H-dependent D-xylose reductase xyl1 [Paraglaciecola agarilytica NO2]GAC11147.1 probable NAD(P)H-dependent D-xylose reductase xyl1 [Paraglaciecola chathamensis S18K6]GGZ55054.1 aldehyde reductase [Paraglaciecola oceanifecundans]|tara:strand:- start:3824 stop:4789 length:966 start_codon:yes stop_codon:yes gene_type:complete
MSLSQSKMPKVGFGLWKIPQDICADAVYEAIKAGYRHLDSACDYGNEVQVGQGIKRAIDEGLCTREDLWITSKLWNTYHAKEHVQQAIERSLSDLQLEYLDLYLIHFPIAQPFVAFDDRYPPEWITDPSAENPKMELAPVPLFETWQAMEALVEKGLTKEIGVCNYNTGLLNDLMAYAKIKPAMLQVESHPYLTQERLMKLAKQYDIQVTAFSPLGALSYLELDMAGAAESVLEQSVVKAAAQRLGKTAAQVVLRWGVQRGNAIIPKTSKPERLAENLAIFDFELSQQEMDDINALNSNRRFNDPGHFCAEAFNTFYPIYD